MTGLQLFQLLKARMGEREAEAFVSYVDENRRQMLADCRTIFATKEDMAVLRSELNLNIANLRTDFNGDIAGLKTDLARFRGELEVKIADVRSDVIRWMFAFFVTMLLAILGLYFKK